MPKIALTDTSVRALKPADRQVTYWDTNLPNFGVRVGKGNRKTFVALIGSRARKREGLGTYPEMSLADARRAARERFSELVLRIERPDPIGFDEALTLFLSTHSKNKHAPRTAHECRRVLTRHLQAKFTGRELSTVKP